MVRSLLRATRIGDFQAAVEFDAPLYVTVASGALWSTAGAVDHDITRVVSGIAHTATSPRMASRHVAQLLLNRVRLANESAPVTPVESGRLMRGD